MAAGNTYEEAIVQGLSEICERESIKRIFTNKIRCKTVPKQEYIKYEQIRNIIEFYEKNGFKITIKDASLNETIPVICTIFEKNGIYSLRFGAHPSLPIAIERTFTEQLQCINIEEYEKLIKECPYYTKEEVNDTPIENIILSISHMFVSFEKNKLIDDIFLNDEIQDKNKLTVWIKNENKITNKELLKFLLKKLSKISSNIFIKDMSFLKFPTVYIFIPEMAELVKWNKTTLDHTINYQMWKNFNETKNRENYNIKSLYKLAKYNVNRHYYFDKLKNVFNCPLEYVIFLCAVKIKDVKNIIKYANLLIKKNNIYKIFEEEQIKMFQIIKNYYLLKQNKHKEQEIKKELEKNYSKNEIKENLEIIKEISFEVILKTVINKKYTPKKIDKKKIEKLIEMYNKANINNTNIKYIFN